MLTDIVSEWSVMVTRKATASQTLKALLASKGAIENYPAVEDVILAAFQQPAAFETVIRKIFYRVMDQQFKRPRQKVMVGSTAFFSLLRGRISTEAFRYFETSLSITASALELDLASVSNGDRRRLQPMLESLAQAHGTSGDSPEAVAWNILHGQVLSVFDREAAAHYFGLVRNSQFQYLVPLFYWDSGATTYYSQGEVDMPAVKENVLTALSTATELRCAATENRTVVSVSVDAHFFRIYIGWFLYYAQQLPELDFSVYVCSSTDEVEGLILEADEYVSAMTSLNRGSKSSNVSYYAVAVPGFVANERTFYACARFFALPSLLSKYENVYLVDADLHFESDPTTFLANVRDYGFAAMSNTGLISLPPWRRTMAGNVVANQSVLETTFLSELLSYMSRGLVEPNSWMLDQNALTYAIERDDDNIVASLGKMVRPTIASKFMTRWEKNYFAVVKPN